MNWEEWEPMVVGFLSVVAALALFAWIFNFISWLLEDEDK